MAKFGFQYADDVRELRAQGVEFASASEGYILADAANWTSGQKAAVTRAINQFEFTAFDKQEAKREAAIFKRRSVASKKSAAATRRARIALEASLDVGLDDDIIEGFWDDGAGDGDEQWDDIDYFDFSEVEELVDEEADDYDEADT